VIPDSGAIAESNNKIRSFSIHLVELPDAVLMMGRDYYMTLTVRDLPPGTTAQDVCDHINRRRANAHPVVGPLVKDPNRPSLCTVVTIRQDSEYLCRTLRDSLNLKTFYPRNPTTTVTESQIAVSNEFLGVTTLAEHENPEFE
jgi:hypothetical protein